MSLSIAARKWAHCFALAGAVTAVLTFAPLIGVDVLGPSRARAADDSKFTDVILSRLPPAETDRYKSLHAKAGRPSGHKLDMTQAEVWRVRSSRLNALRMKAESEGVGIRVVGSGDRALLAPMTSAAGMTGKQSEMMALDKAAHATMAVGMAQLAEPSLAEYALTMSAHHDPKGGKVDATPPALYLPIEGAGSVAVRRTSLVKAAHHYVWRGEIEGTNEDVTLLWWPDGHVSGTIRYRDRYFAIKSAGAGMHEVVEKKNALMPPEHAPASLELLSRMNMTEDPLVRQGDASMMRPKAAGDDDAPGKAQNRPRPTPEEVDRAKDASPRADDAKPVRRSRRNDIDRSQSRPGPAPAEIVIRLLVAYTPQVSRHYEDVPRDLVALAVEEANQSFRNSGVGFVRLELAHAYETDYVESGTHFDHVWRFADKGDGIMEEVHALRDQHKADVAVLVVHDPAGCGLATRVAAEADEAFAVVHHDCAVSMYSLAHEIGHIIGARHDYALDSTSAPFPFGHGFVHGKSWRTMMSYKDTCGDCPRLPVWSSPDVTIKGVRAGSERHNNAKVIADQAARVAAFR